MGFTRKEYWSGLPFPSPGDLFDPGIKPKSLTLQAEYHWAIWEVPGLCVFRCKWIYERVIERRHKQLLTLQGNCKKVKLVYFYRKVKLENSRKGMQLFHPHSWIYFSGDG